MRVEEGSAGVELRVLNSMEEMLRLPDLQKEIWGYGRPDADLPYPARCLFALAESGGLVAAAFCHDAPVALSVAWIGKEGCGGRYYLHSQLVGVLPAYRHLSIGYRLKLQQRDFALQSGIDWIRWTFDPLQSVNANLNLRKLGAVVTEYRLHYYGRLQSNFSDGMASDRMWADWYVKSPRVMHRLETPPSPLSELPDLPRATELEEQIRDSQRLRRLARCRLDLREPRLAVEIPNDFDRVRRLDQQLASEWQEKIREIFQTYLAQGYLVSDFLVVEATSRRVFYLLTRASVEEVLQS